MAATQNQPTGAIDSVISVSTTDPNTPVTSAPGSEDALYPDGIPDPKGTAPAEEQRAREGENTDPTAGTGVEGEVVVWEAHYSIRNFIGRLIVRIALTIAWVILAVYTWGEGNSNLAPLTWTALAVVVVLWLGLAYQAFQARYSHHYELTNRRLFVSTGILNRRRDMMELLRVKDVFTRQQSLLERFLKVGTVVVVPGEKELPTFYLTGVADPQEVMDLTWHHARAERDQRSVKVDRV
jgi:membrane protein YdbS with pleckstrin-like domain